MAQLDLFEYSYWVYNDYVSNKSVRNIALWILILPMGFISLFLFGEVFGGDISGLGHLLQLIPILILFWVSRKWPEVGGTLLMIAGIFLGGLFATSPQDWRTILIVEIILFVPLVVAGYLLRISKK